MPRKCAIPGCTSNSGKFTSYTPVFSFPKDETRRQTWIKAVSQKYKIFAEEDPGPNACVCVHHFDLRFVEKQPQIKPQTPGLKYPTTKLRLLKDAIPSNFEPVEDKRGKPKAIKKIKKKYEKYTQQLIKRETFRASNTKDFKPPKIEQPSEELINRIKEEQLKIQIYSTYLQDYGPEYYNSEWDKNYRILQESMDKQLTNPLNWSVDKVASQITKTCQNADIGEMFRDQEIDGSVLLDLSKEDLMTMMGLKLGPSIKISTLIEKLREQVLTKHVVTSDDLK